MRPRVIAIETMENRSSLLTCQAGSGLAEPKGHSASGRGGDASAGPVSSAGKGFTIVRLADGYGVGGLQDPERPYEFVFMAVLKQACKTSVSIIQ
jgi:hypothetical protein